GDILRSAPGCLVIDQREPGGYATPYEAAGEDATYVSRIREDATIENGLMMWVVSDNLRKGAALNAVQIAETLISRKLIQAKQKAAESLRGRRASICEGHARPCGGHERLWCKRCIGRHIAICGSRARLLPRGRSR